MNNSGIRRLISFFLALVLIFGMSLPVSADDSYVVSEMTVNGGASGEVQADGGIAVQETAEGQESIAEDLPDAETPEEVTPAESEESAAEEPSEASGDTAAAGDPSEVTENLSGTTGDPSVLTGDPSVMTEDPSTLTEDPAVSAEGFSEEPQSGAEVSDIFLEEQEIGTATVNGTAQSEAAIKDGVYIFRSVLNNDYVLDVKDGGIFNGTKIRLRLYDKSDSEMFNFKRNSDGTYTITAYNCGKALEAAGGKTDNGTPLQIYKPNKHAGQRWRVYRNADKTYTIKNAITKQAIDIAGGVAENGRVVQMWKSNNSDAQKFRLRMITRPKHKYIGQHMILSSKSSSKVVDIAGGSKAMCANVQLYKANGTTAQWHQLAYVGDGYYRIINMKSRKTLDVAGGSMKSGTNVQQYSFNGSAAQLWRIEDNGDGTVTFHSKKKDSMVLVFAGGKTANGTNIQIGDDNNSAAQKFVLDKTGKKSLGTQAQEFKGLSEAAVVKKIGPLCKADQKKSGVLACITIAQFILESGYASTDLAQNANNCFGMKTSLSGNTWKGSAWDGVSVYTKKTAEYDGSGKKYYIMADFRKYLCIEDSIADHSAYLTGAKNGSTLRYSGLKGQKDYKKAIKIIKNGGYATDPQYVNKICNIIERFDLTKFNA